MISSMRDLERTWNRKFNYPWTFFNDVPFDDDFKRLVKLETKAKVNFGEIAPRFRLQLADTLNHAANRGHP